jgi:hypothetical protein
MSEVKAYLAPQDMCDSHKVIIDDIGEMICGPLIRLQNDEIVVGPKPGYLSAPEDQVGRYISIRCRLISSVT